MSVDRILERATNLAIVLSAIAFVTIVAKGWTAGTSGSTGAPRYAVGQKLEQLDARVSFSAAPKTVLVFTNSNCQYCLASIPFYKRLIARRDEAQSSVPIIAIAKQSQELLNDFLTTNGLKVDRAVELTDPSKFVMNITPSILVVDSKGVITSLWIGKIPSTEEEKVLKTILMN